MRIIKKVYPLLGLLLALFCASANAETVGKVTALSGKADYSRQGKASQNLSPGDLIEKHDIIRTKRHSRLEITFHDGSKITLAQRTRMIVEDYVTGEQANALFSITRGKIRAFVTDAFSKRKESFKTRSRTAIAGVQGTDYEMHSSAYGTQVFVHKGLVSFQSLEPGITLIQLLRAGESALIRPASPPVVTNLASGKLSPTTQTTNKSKTSNEKNIISTDINSGGMQDLIASGLQTQDPSTLAPQKNVTIPLPPSPNLP